jgi:hypothetical protein
MKEDAMKNLEYRTYDSKREMDILEATDKVKELNRREANIDFDVLMKKIRESHDKDNNNIGNKTNNDDKVKDKEKIMEKKEIEKMFKNIKNQKKLENSGRNTDDKNKNILDKLIKGIDYKINKDKKIKENSQKDKENKLKEKLENNFFLKKKVEREEKEIENSGTRKEFGNFLDDSNEDSENSDKEKNIKNIFKKPFENFSYKKCKK